MSTDVFPPLTPPANAGSRPSIHKRKTGPHAPLSFAQQRLFLLQKRDPESAAYNMTGAVRFIGSLNVDLLTRALNEIIRRHETLRTTFTLESEGPLQIVRPFERFHLPLINWTDLPESAAAQALKTAISEEASKPFDLETGPVARLHVYKVKANEHVLLMSVHHALFDGWSMGVFIKELVTLYTLGKQGRPLLIAPLQFQYGDYAAWQQELIQGPAMQSELNYWRGQLSGAPELLALPTDYARPARQSFRGATFSAVLPKQLTEAIQALGRREHCTLFMTLLAAFQLLLARYTRSSDIVVGTPIAGRTESAMESLIGCFLNTLVLRTEVSEARTFEELLRIVKSVALEAYAHQDIPFDVIVANLLSNRTASHHPIFQVLFSLNNAPKQTLALPGVMVQLEDGEETTAKFDLALNAVEESGEVKLVFEYSADLFEERTVAAMAGHYQRILETVTEKPASLWREIDLLTEAESARMIRQWNETASPYPDNTCIHHLIEEQVKRAPDAVALITDSIQMTYQTLDENANQLAHHLRSVGVRPEVLVGICTEKDEHMIVAILAVLKAGGAYVPIDPGYPQQRIAYMVDDACLPIILTTSHLAPLLQNMPAGLIRLDEEWSSVEVQSREAPDPQAGPFNTAYVIYTSGSTGQPKGILLAHQGLCNLILSSNQISHVSASSRVLQFASFSFDVSVWETFMALVAGGTLCLGGKSAVFSSDELVARINRQGVTVALLPPSLLRLVGPEKMPCLRTIIAVGEKCPGDAVKLWAGGERKFFNDYGPAECTVTVTSYLTSERDGDTDPPMGRPLANTQAYILDENLQPVPVGVLGEVYIAGVGLARGYLNRPGLTAEKFVPNPFSAATGGRMYRTGDLGRFQPDGNIVFAGRADHQVKIRGFRIELGEIECALTQHPRVQQSIVLVRDDLGGGPRLVAYLVSEPGGTIASAELKTFVAGRLPSYMIPSAFVVLEAWPLSPNGKVDRNALRSINSDPGEAIPTRPLTATEKAVAEIWQQLLGITSVRPEDNFFEVGGQSLLATMLVSRVRERFGVELPLVVLFEQSTMGEIASVIADAVAKTDSSLAIA